MIDLNSNRILNTIYNRLFGGGNYTVSLTRRLIKRDLYIRHRFPEFGSMKICEDLAMSIQMHYYAKSVAYVHKLLVHYNKCNESSLIHAFGIRRPNDVVNNFHEVMRTLLYVEKT